MALERNRDDVTVSRLGAPRCDIVAVAGDTGNLRFYQRQG